jgi:hypothetical protein
MPGYYFQNFDDQPSGQMPTNWLKTPTTPYFLTSNLQSISAPNSVSTRMQSSKQAALNLSTVGIDMWDGEHFYFSVRTPTLIPVKPEAPYFAICNTDFSGAYINSTMFKCSLMLRGIGGRPIYYGSGGMLFDSGLDWIAGTWYDCEIVLDPSGNTFSIYMNSVPIVENFPAGPGQVESFILEGDSSATNIFYLDDFQIGEEPIPSTPLILKDTMLRNSKVVI